MTIHNWNNRPASPTMKGWVKLSQSLSCGGCNASTQIDSKYTCKVCGRMLCGNCGSYCKDHKAEQGEE